MGRGARFHFHFSVFSFQLPVPSSFVALSRVIEFLERTGYYFLFSQQLKHGFHFSELLFGSEVLGYSRELLTRWINQDFAPNSTLIHVRRLIEVTSAR